MKTLKYLANELVAELIREHRNFVFSSILSVKSSYVVLATYPDKSPKQLAEETLLDQV